MRTIRVIQLGDVHYPEYKDAVAGDLKDPAAAASMQAAIAPKKLRRVFEALNHVKTERLPCGLLICGDLTTKGEIGAYAECVKYLTDNANLTDVAVSPRDHWHVVTGNHDVARKDLEPNKSPFPALFQPLAIEWGREFNPSALTVAEMRTSALVDADCGVQLYSLNSCVGCGEWRRVPAKIRDAMSDGIKELLAKQLNEAAALEMAAEQLDAPIITDDHIQSLCGLVEQSL